MTENLSTLERIKLAQAGDSVECGKIIEENSSLIWSIVKRFFGRGADSDDLYQLGCIGMMKAVYGYRFDYGTMFSTYAVPKISGEIRRFLRDDGMIKVSRSLKASAYKISCVREQLIEALGREPKLSELSEATGLCVEDIAACESANFQTDSLQRELFEDGTTLEESISSADIEETVLNKVMLSEAISILPCIEQKVIKLRFFKALTQEQTAKILSISQVQVSRLEKRAIQKLKRKIS